MAGLIGPGNPMKVLIVDDEPGMRVTLAEILEDEGYEVLTAASGEEAVARCAERSFDVVLMDVRMPGIDGVEAFRRIRRAKEQVRVILMSAYSVQDLRRLALEEGAVAFLPKPLDIEVVVRLISEVNDTAILVAEPDDDTALAVVAPLRSRGYRVTRASTRREAFELAEQIKFDIVLIDTRMSAAEGDEVESGLDLYLGIKRLTPSAIAVMISGEAGEDAVARRAISNNAYTVVYKPIEPESLLRMLAELDRQRAGGEITKPPLPPRPHAT